MANNNFTINTPHAAVIVFNYLDRIAGSSVTGTDRTNLADIDTVQTKLISTLSCISIETTKSKSDPQGSFNLVLAPTKNWVSTLTPGSWCVLLMSQQPITQDDLLTGNKNQVKMIGKIDSVRVDTQMQDDGSRRTLYYVTGMDWGHIFHSILYVDPLINSEGDNAGQGENIFIAMRDALFKFGTPQSFNVNDNLNSIIQLFGKSTNMTETGDNINRLAKSIYTFRMPQEMINYFDFRDADGNVVDSKDINQFLSLITGTLTGVDQYQDFKESAGFLNPFSFTGSNSLWQILLDNSNPAMNEMFCEMVWNQTNDSDNSLQLAIFNRIKPFSFKNFSPEAGAASRLKSYFQFIRLHDIDLNSVISVNAGTNWKDKYNFIEVKPQFQDFQVFANWYKQKAQIADQSAFSREGFRPLIVDTKQFPSKGLQVANDDSLNAQFDPNQLAVWVQLMKEWYFDTHRMLNGTLTMAGTTEYIGVGDNIRFDAQLVNPTQNMNTDQLTASSPSQKYFILGHVESVNHKFSVSIEGARSYQTVIQFVRGIVVNSKNMAINDGTIDTLSSKITQTQEKNTTNTLGTSDSLDPDPQKTRGT